MAVLRVVLADDHRLFIEGLKRLLGEAGGFEICGVAHTSESALALILEQAPDVAVLDIGMPNKSGINLLMDMRRCGTTTPVIFLTMHKSAAMAHRALCAGARGYVLKDEAFQDLLQAMRAVAAGERFVSQAVERLLAAEPQRPLSERELEVLLFIAAGYSSREIAEALKLSLRTVQTHREHIMSKLSVHKAADLVRYAVNAGLVDE